MTGTEKVLMAVLGSAIGVTILLAGYALGMQDATRAIRKEILDSPSCTMQLKSLDLTILAPKGTIVLRKEGLVTKSKVVK